MKMHLDCREVALREVALRLSRTVDDEMSEPTQTMNAEKRMVDETANELRAALPITTSCHARSSRSDDETHEKLTLSTNHKDES